MPDLPDQRRVAWLAAHDIPRAGSFIPTMIAVLEEARAQGWVVEAVLPEESRDFGWVDEFRDRQIAVTFVPRTPRATAAAALRSMWKDDLPTILHTHFTNFDLPAIAAKHARTAASTSVIWHSHDSYPTSRVLRLRRRLKFALAARRVAAVLFVGRESAVELGGRAIAADRVMHVPNAVDVRRFPLVSDEARSAARQALEIPAQAAVLLHFGWSWHRKGGDVFVAAVRELRAAGVDVVGVTVGGGDEARAAAAAAGVADSMLVLEPVESVVELYAAADVFVSCSRSEGDPYSVLEAASCGLGTVVSLAPGQGGDGPPTSHSAELDPQAIAATVEVLLARSSATRQEDGVAGRRWVEANVGIARYSETMIAVYERVLANEVPIDPAAAARSTEARAVGLP